MRDRRRTAERKPEGVKLLWGFLAEAIRDGIQCLVLQILKYASVILIGSVLRRKRNVTNLRELCAVIERRHLDCSDSLLRGISILQRTILPDICGRNTID